MAYTKHGHHIPGTGFSIDPPNSVDRCGGVRICAQCKADASDYQRAARGTKKPLITGGKEVGEAYLIDGKLKAVTVYDPMILALFEPMIQDG